eukprot:Protomagalhaensia_sp_Gyna_25__1216@NODE_1602_length_1698_cov_206_746835_g1308_i0_p1_GENE_NODE_1602_length_1698_cov_206_746835_g1308_i0NODE_1602_length_1698_cov_206_746835_g1308_i0_p1_ORF_typecomplete_len423_score70_27Ank_2/PF12796_7/8_8e17Ank_2/PF12796_7/2_4e11Ank_2/PF12796_7/2_9e09Ank_2/PF12796_7/4e12Ank_2/PF12796_7/3_1e02Ank_5/PF13857_6/0_00028Ank_5/PF13857_6/2_7e09Ank_5/PF13857_6/3_6e11Ank_5/PF13857_6/0_0028Ank_5/PF13857_6/0_00016Ank_5/PF13857_6/23Ank_5/PF13857_6/9_7e09Ank_5/PF13857_6/5_6e10A
MFDFIGSPNVCCSCGYAAVPAPSSPLDPSPIPSASPFFSCARVAQNGPESTALRKLLRAIAVGSPLPDSLWPLNVCSQTPPFATPLTAASRMRHSAVTPLLAAGALPDLRDGAGRSPLAIAAEMGDSVAVAALLAAGATVNMSDSHGTPPLHLAAAGGATETVALLLAAGASPTDVARDGRNVLTAAAAAGQPSMVQQLVAAGALVNAQMASTGESPLMAAALSGSEETVSTLVEFGADAALRLHGSGHSALMLALQAGHDHLMAPLLKAGGLNVRDAFGRTALMLATESRRFPVAAALLTAGAAVDLADHEDRKTALHSAAAQGALLLVMKLMAHGADVNCKDSAGFTPLMRALANDQFLCAHQLLQGDAWIPEENSKIRLSALQLAARKCHKPLFAELLRRTIPYDTAVFLKARQLLCGR